MQDAQGMQCNCINLSYQVLVTWMVFLYCRFFLTPAAMLTFLLPGFLPWTPQPFDSQTSAGEVPARWRCQQVKALGSFQCMPTSSADIKHLCEKFMLLAETAKRCVFHGCYSCQYCHLTAAGRKAYHCRPDLSLCCYGNSLKINCHFLPCHKMLFSLLRKTEGAHICSAFNKFLLRGKTWDRQTHS